MACAQGDCSSQFFFWCERLFYRQCEQFGNFEGERQTRIVLSGLGRVDGLPGNVQLLAEFGLGPAFDRTLAGRIVGRG
jgi:hypothetical protein